MIDLRLAITHRVFGDQPVKIRCREHNDKTASLAVYADHIHCYGCGFTLKVPGKGLPCYRDPLAYLLNISDEESARVANRYSSTSSSRQTPARTDPPMVPDATVLYPVEPGPHGWERRDKEGDLSDKQFQAELDRLGISLGQAIMASGVHPYSFRELVNKRALLTKLRNAA